ncbi:glycosyl hydrolase 115 family protein [Halalkalibacter sp. APA_J-10(15)]|uniref:glycosyl hydrolase 115 family protein n=1 Tax=Halalkalibacter sp. APA_J-10(15) TaxID=2933805 RepID=UPI001FF5E5E9|nr:glycosyl hydrolase 115 family protein [Halalkalibacter sp. APA_J-10(15)]MCK0473445.1 glycosyl hydrolase 115 family protein [Halalkalibacter sp. APA_J-10(15)]
MEGKTLICSREQKINIYLAQNELPAVRIAAHNLTKDINQVCGGMAEVSDREGKVAIGTIANNKAMEKRLKDKEIDTECLLDGEGNYRWEGYLIQEKDGILYIIGTDRRGTIFGIYEFSKMIGVSPWHFFADVPVKKLDSIVIDKEFKTSSYPSVQYRGIFLNDEEQLEAWAKEHTNDHTIGPETYVHIFELLLRLKANYIWPAMHVNYFNEDPENGRLAEEMGIVVGTSHCDMLLRSNQNEWEPWLKKKGYEGISYDYSIPGRHREILKEYWRESVEQNKDYEVCYTVGMRGVHDYGFKTDAIDHNPNLNMEEKEQEKVKLLGNIIKDQRKILGEVLGKENAETSLQTFIPYKEVLPLYDAGLELPDDVTLIWVDDNFGYMRRYPDAKERKRSGGHGVYFHSSYWAHPGMSYLYINSIPLAHTGNEMKKCYENGIRKLWVLNVGALKPLEQDIEYFLTYGWEAGNESAVTKDTRLFTEKWIDFNFTGNYGKKAASLYKRFTQITNVCKIEHLAGDKFSQTIYGDEAGLRVNQLKEIYDEANELYFDLPQNERDSFFQLFLMKIHASYYANAEFYYADRSHLSYEQGKMQSADTYIEKSRKVMEYRRCMLHFYNKIMSGGKWDKILTPESFSPPPTAMYPAGTPALKIEQPGSNIIVWGERTPETNQKITFDSYGTSVKWFEIFNTGAERFDFTVDLSSCNDWVEVSEDVGTVIDEKRILVKLKEKCGNEEKKGKIVIKTSLDDKYQIDVFAQKREDIPEHFQGYVEADGFVSMKADHFTSESHSNDNQWQIIKDIGRMDGSVIEAAGGGYPDEIDVKNHASVTYPFLLKSKGHFLLEIHRFLTLDATGKIRFAVSIDDLEPIIIETETNDEWRGNWRNAVLNNGEKLYVSLPFLNSGVHKLTIHMIDRYVTISKFVMYTDKDMTRLSPENLDQNSSILQSQVCNLGPVESYFIGNSQVERNSHFKTIPECTVSDMEKLCTNIYSMKAGTAPLPNLVYAGIDFWNYDRLYMLNEEYPQFQKGASRYIPDPLGYKNVIPEFGSGYFIENNGVIAIEAEYALEQSNYAYTQKSSGHEEIEWTHTQAETNGSSGMAMYIRKSGLSWLNALDAPSLHYKIKVTDLGTYRVWMLIKFDENFSDSCYIGLDGTVQPYDEQFSKGRLYTYSTKQIWFWTLLSELDIDEGIHDFAIYAGKSGLRIDRIYLTKGDENAPNDASWKDSERVSQ